MRKYISMQVKLEAALIQLGLDPMHVRLDHHPPLEQRLKLPGGYVPDANNPLYLQWLSTADHDLKTSGRRGTSKLSKRGGDLSEIAKTKRLEKQHKLFRQRLLAKAKGEAKEPPRERARWPKRKFPPGRKIRDAHDSRKGRPHGSSRVGGR